MLVVHSRSTCDVCLEGYSSTKSVPHSISCGHVFCLACLQSLTRSKCPICRTEFVTGDIRRIHIDHSPAFVDEHLPSSPRSEASESERSQVKQFQESITRIVRQGDTMIAVREKIDEIRTWLKSQDRDEYPELRASFLLLFRYTELQRQDLDLQREVLQAHTDLDEAEKVVQDLQEKLTAQGVAADAKYEKLVRSSREEKYRAVSMEKTKRDHAEKMEREWKQKYDEANSRCRQLQDDLDRNRRNPLPTPPQPKDGRSFYMSSTNSSLSDLGQKLEYWASSATPSSYTSSFAHDTFSSTPTTPALTDDDIFDPLTTDVETEKEVMPKRMSAPATLRKAPTPAQEMAQLALLSPVLRSAETSASPRRPTRERSNTVHGETRRMLSPVRRRTDPEPHERRRGLHDLRGQLADLLDQPQPKTAQDPSTRPALPRTRSSQAILTFSPQAEPRRRKMSVPDDVASSSSTPPPPPPPPPPPVPAYMPPAVLVHASSAAWAAERLRTTAQTYKATPTRPAFGTPLRDVTTYGDPSSPVRRRA